jgi:hypothetical protein
VNTKTLLLTATKKMFQFWHYTASQKSGPVNTKISPLTATKEMFQVLALYSSLTFLTNLKVLNFYASFGIIQHLNVFNKF